MSTNIELIKEEILADNSRQEYKKYYKEYFNLQMDIPLRPEGDFMKYTKEQVNLELAKCGDKEFGLFYWIWNYVKIYDNSSRQWIPFKLFPAQARVLLELLPEKYGVVLKARQLGLSWLFLAFFLWEGLFFPEILALLFSKREDEAVELLHFRIKGMYMRLPRWMQANNIKSNTKKEFWISNGSRWKASSAGGSDSYAATHALIDEADIVYQSGKNLSRLLTDLEPTVGSSPDGRLFLISRSDKGRPKSTFKEIFRASQRGESQYKGIFLPWYSRPDRTEEWYLEKAENSIVMHGTLDGLREQYPETPEDALAPPETDKRFNAKFIRNCYYPITVHEFMPEYKLQLEIGLPLNEFLIYKMPIPESQYVITADPAEGNINSDPSAAIVWDVNKNEQVAQLHGLYEPAVFAEHVFNIANIYNNALIFPERNNHGGTAILWWQQNDARLVEGNDSTRGNQKWGWRTTVSSKPLMWSFTANMLNAEKLVFHNQKVFFELTDIRSTGSLSAGKGNHDDLAVCVGLFCTWKELFNFGILFDFL